MFVSHLSFGVFVNCIECIFMGVNMGVVLQPRIISPTLWHVRDFKRVPVYKTFSKGVVKK